MDLDNYLGFLGEEMGSLLLVKPQAARPFPCCRANWLPSACWQRAA